MKCFHCDKEATHVKHGENGCMVNAVCVDHIKEEYFNEKYDPVWVFKIENLQEIFDQINRDYEASMDNWDGG